MAKIKKGKYENTAWNLLYAGLGLTFFIGLLFLLHQNYSFDTPIASDVFGQFGDIIGGVVGTIVAFVSFLLLLDTLNEQREQFSTQQALTETAIQEQRVQFQKQSEDQIFYHLIDKQQNRIISSFVTKEEKTYSGHTGFKFLVDQMYFKINAEAVHLGRCLIQHNPNGIEDDYLQSIFSVKHPKISFDQFGTFKTNFIGELNKRNDEDRWEYLKVFFGAIDQELPGMRDQLDRIGSTKFYKIDFNRYRKFIYENKFDELYREYGDFLDVYFKELEFISKLIQSSLNKELYSSYFISNITKYERILIFYYLLSGKSSIEILNLAKQYNLLNLDRSLLMDLPSEQQLEVEIENLLALYNTKIK